MVLADVVNHDDVATGELRGRTRLRLKPQTALRPGTNAGIEQLDRDGAAQSQIPPITDLGHRAAAENTAQFVATAAEDPASRCEHPVSVLGAVMLSSLELRVVPTCRRAASGFGITRHPETET